MLGSLLHLLHLDLWWPNGGDFSNTIDSTVRFYY